MTRIFCLISLSSALAFGAEPRPQNIRLHIGPSIQPLVIIGEGWSQQFTFINVEYYQSGSSMPESTIGALRFIRSDGIDWPVPLKNYGVVNQIPVNLKPGQMLSVEAEVLNTPQVLGWAILDLPNSNSWGIYHSFTTFRKQLTGRPDFLTSVPFVDGLEDEWIIPFDNRDGKYPGIGVVNTSNLGSTTFRFDAYDSAGNLRRTFIKTIALRIWRGSP
jgi:hypothetical protein